MSLSTQLARGTLALPMLAMFALLAVVEAPRAEPATLAAEARTELEQAVCQLDANRPHALVLAQAPGDLGTLVVRLNSPCRA